MWMTTMDQSERVAILFGGDETEAVSPGLAFLSSHVMEVPSWPNGMMTARHLALGHVLGRDHYIFLLSPTFDRP